MKVTNNALLRKWLWKFSNKPDLLWRKLVNFLYYAHKWIWMNIKQQVGKSQFWKGILKFLEPFLLRTTVILGNGRASAFWRDLWCSEVTLANLFLELLHLVFNPDVSVYNCINNQNYQFKRSLTGILLNKFQELQLIIIE